MFLEHDTALELLTGSAGLLRLIEMFTVDPLWRELEACLPKRVAYSSYPPLHFVAILLAGFWLGYDCLDDLEKMRQDPLLLGMFGEIPCAKSFGNFLRDCEDEQIQALRAFLTRQALGYRKRLRLQDRAIEFSIDSTDHVHHGDLIEGLELNYKGHWCLDSLEVFDEKGFCYDFALRPGATFSSVGSVAMMNTLMDHRPLLPHAKSDLIHADSAFCFEEFIRMCLLRRLKGTITAHGNIGWREKIATIDNWRPWQFTAAEIEKSLKSQRPLPRIEVGYYMYSPGWAENISFPVVVKRTFKPYERIPTKKRAEMIKTGQNPKEGLWEHYAVLSLMGLHPRTPQEILEIHQTRSNMENMIKEEKIAFDLRHFPCRKMKANHAYALFGLMAHNFFRLLAWLDQPRHPQFAKALRARFVHLPGRIVKGQRKLRLRIPEPFNQEVETLVSRWVETFKPPRSTA
jgi:hypothetical protein